MESYPIGASGGVRVEVQRAEHADDGLAGLTRFSVCLAVDDGSVVVRLPGHYGAELAARLRDGEEALGRGGRRLAHLPRRVPRPDGAPRRGGARPQLDLARAPAALRPPRRPRPRGTADLLDRAHKLVDTLRHGVGLVPDRLPDGFAT